ncbi:MAG: DUF885 family protein [Gemmatimonadaceae bacterium]
MQGAPLGVDPARPVSDTLDRFFEHYFRRRPVNATFTGVHRYDSLLPDWSARGLAAQRAEMVALHAELAAAHPVPPSETGYGDDVVSLDAELARAFLEIQLAEDAGLHGVRSNPALWAGEAVFSIVSLMIRDFAPFIDRVDLATARLERLPAFLDEAVESTKEHAFPESWTTRALRDCQGASILLTRGIDRWLASGVCAPSQALLLRHAADGASHAVERFASMVRAHAALPDDAAACGPVLYDLLLRRGHMCHRSRGALLADARVQLRAQQARLDVMSREHSDGWPGVQACLAALHPAPDDYLESFARTWAACRQTALAHDVVTWPDWPLRYTTIPECTRDAAPFLYYLFYRAPAPFDAYDVHEYVVPPLPAGDTAAHLRTWNSAAITLNHVVHHGAVGHHVQNWHAYHRAASRVGTVAAVDCANRIGMFCGGTMAEGWACYATQLMDELGFLSPLERVSEQHSRVRFLARAIVDMSFHEGSLSFHDAIALFATETGMDSSMARAEVVKCSMFPGTAIMYWLGTQHILELRAEHRRTQGSAFTLRAFHDELLGYGSLPVPLVSRLMQARLS